MTSANRFSGERTAQIAVALTFALIASLRIPAIYTENVNWDEFALLDRAARSHESQRLIGGGRPGLAVLHLMPLVGGCTDEIATIRRARWVWTGWTILLVAGLWRLIVQVRRTAVPHPWRGAALAAGLLVLVPDFLRWSIHVRSDQPALAAALWGGVALLASRRRPAFALAAGALSAVGFLFSQKAVYVLALVALLAAAEPFLACDLRWRREFLRLALGGLAAIAVVALFYIAISRWRQPPMLVGLESGFDVFAFYRAATGYRVYRGMLPALGAHLVLGGLFAVACGLAVARRGRSPGGRAVVLALAVLAFGVAVGWFHAGAFPYFWMTLGLFPAVAAGCALEAAVGWLPTRGARLGAIGVVAALLLASGLPAAVRLLADTQSVQAESLAFIGRHFGPEAVGFHPERAPFCRAPGNPFPTYFSQDIAARFGGPGSSERIDAFLEEMRDRQVHYLLDSHRLRQFPAAIQRFWAANYAPYYARVLLPARTFSAAAGEEMDFEIVVPGRYLWLQRQAPDAGGLVVDGSPVAAGSGVELAAGGHRAAFTGGPVHGTLRWAVDEAPDPSAEPFYSEAVLAEFHGIGR